MERPDQMKNILRLSFLSLAILLIIARCGKKMEMPSEVPLARWGAGDTTYVRINPPWDRNHPYGQDFHSPRDVIIGRDGNIWVADSLFVWKLDRAGRILSRDLVPGVEDIRAIDQGPDLRIYVVRGDSNAYHLNGSFFLSQRKARFTGVAVDDDNWIYLADSGRQMLLKFSGDDLSQSDTLATHGSGGGTVELPRGIATDLSLNVYFVQEGGSFHVQKLRPSGDGYQPAVYFGLEGDSLKQFITPQDVAVDADGYIYVADTGNHRIQKFTPYGGLKIAFGDSGSAGEQFISPRGIAVDEDLILYIADTGNNRVERYQLSTEIDIPEVP
jgi:DNA-binding beta-propeller fold protein YncE